MPQFFSFLEAVVRPRLAKRDIGSDSFESEGFKLDFKLGLTAKFYGYTEIAAHPSLLSETRSEQVRLELLRERQFQVHAHLNFYFSVQFSMIYGITQVMEIQ